MCPDFPVVSAPATPTLRRRHCLLGWAASLVTGCASVGGRAVALIVPAPAGAAGDSMARAVQPELSRHLGRSVVVENLPGADGALGSQRVAHAAPDGRTLLLGSPIELMLTPLGLSQAAYQPEDLRPVGGFATTPLVMLARTSLGVNGVDELLRRARKPGSGELRYASAGPGSLEHLLGERFSRSAGLKTHQVPYKHPVPLLQDLVSGQFDVVFLPWSAPMAEAVAAGQFKALAVTAPDRSAAPASLPLMKDIPGLEDFVYSVWTGLQVPYATPEPVQERLHQACNGLLALPGLRRVVEAGGASLAPPRTLAELRQAYLADISRYRALARAVGLRIA